MATKRKVAKKKSKPARRRSASPKRAASMRCRSRRAREYSVKERTAAAAETPLAVCENEKNMQAMLTVLRNTDEPVKVRLAALQSLQAASFSVLAFEACRGDYIATLRKIADDPDPELRQRVLGTSGAREGRLRAEEAAGRIARSCQGPAAAREGAAAPELRCARRRLCGGARHRRKAAQRDGAARGPAAARGRRHRRARCSRSCCATRTSCARSGRSRRPRSHALKPERLQKHAREILLDKSDYDDIKATSLTALTQFGDEQALAKDKALAEECQPLPVGQDARPSTSRPPGASSSKYDRQE